MIIRSSNILIPNSPILEIKWWCFLRFDHIYFCHFWCFFFSHVFPHIIHIIRHSRRRWSWRALLRRTSACAATCSSARRCPNGVCVRGRRCSLSSLGEKPMECGHLKYETWGFGQTWGFWWNMKIWMEDLPWFNHQISVKTCDLGLESYDFLHGGTHIPMHQPFWCSGCPSFGT